MYANTVFYCRSLIIITCIAVSEASYRDAKTVGLLDHVQLTDIISCYINIMPNGVHSSSSHYITVLVFSWVSTIRVFASTINPVCKFIIKTDNSLWHMLTPTSYLL